MDPERKESSAQIIARLAETYDLDPQDPNIIDLILINIENGGEFDDSLLVLGDNLTN